MGLLVDKNPDIILRDLDWDSEQLGVRCGLIDASALAGSYDPEILSERILNEVEKSGGPEFITIKLPQHFIATLNALLVSGAALVDTELTFACSESSQIKPSALPDECRLEFCDSVDSKPFLALADEMRGSRFFLDPAIPNEKALALWRASIKNHCEGFADKLLVAYTDDDPSGIVTLSFKSHDSLYLHIVGVRREYQSKRIGSRMLGEIIDKHAADRTIYVETQSLNTPAQRLYRGAGFRFHSLRYILHYWRG